MEQAHEKYCAVQNAIALLHLALTILKVSLIFITNLFEINIFVHTCTGCKYITVYSSTVFLQSTLRTVHWYWYCVSLFAPCCTNKDYLCLYVRSTYRVLTVCTRMYCDCHWLTNFITNYLSDFLNTSTASIMI